METKYKKLAGTAAVFILEKYDLASPVERDGMVWKSSELHLKDCWPSEFNKLPAMANALALEGLEDYDPPAHGDVRAVKSLGVKFVYLQKIRGWLQMPDETSC